MSYRIGILNQDKKYSYGLMEYLNNTEYHFKAITFSGELPLRDYLRTQKLEFLLIDEELESLDIDVPTIYVSEQREDAKEGYIYKYQSMNAIAKKLLSYMKKEQVDYQKLRMYGVYSPLGRCGKTTIAKEICKHHRNSLYINMEEYPEEVDTSTNSEVFIYYLANYNPEVLNLIAQLKEDFRGNKSILGVNFYQDLRHISKSNISWFLDMLKANMDFKRVVFDIGQGVLMDIDILSCFDRVIVPTLSDEISLKKLQLFKSNIASRESIGSKVTYLSLGEEDLYLRGFDEIIEREEL